MLREARTRMVDVETGDEPRPMRALEEESAEPPREPPVRRPSGDRSAKSPPAPPPSAPEPAPSPTPGEPTADTLVTDEVLWLGDLPAGTAPEAGSDSPGTAPWRRGLRG
jgi:hypothetical protein